MRLKKKILSILSKNTLFKFISSFYKSNEEKEFVKKRGNFYAQFFKNEGEIYFDIGANYGNRIEPILNKNLKIIAVEPQKSCIRFLKMKFGGKIVIVPKGVSSKLETRTMYLANVNTISSFSQEWISSTQESGRFSNYNWDEKVDVQMTTLDELIAQFGTPKFIKVDVEGFELEVLKGLSQSIHVISFEYTIPEGKETILGCIDRLAEISKSQNLLFNYSVGESMTWALKNWLSPLEMKEEISKESFIQTEFGDIYARMKE